MTANLDSKLAETMSPDFVYSSAFTYSFLNGVDTTGTHRPKSITIPQRDLDAMSGMERQYWDIKRQHFDVVLFFKKGKFYELYDADAVIGNKEFGLKMTQDLNNRGKMRMSGVPEQSFAEWSRLFVFKGYKVGKVEQMVVDDAMRAANGGKDPKVIPRELTVILTRGTLTENNAIAGPEPVYVLSVAPLISNGNSGSHGSDGLDANARFDAVAVDLSRQCYFHCPCDSVTEFVTLLHHMRPKEVLLPAHSSSNNNSSSNNTTSKSAQTTQATQKSQPTPAVAASASSPAAAAVTAVSHIVADLLPDCNIEPIALAQAAQQQSPLLPPSWHLVRAYFEYLKIDAERLLPRAFHAAPALAAVKVEGQQQHANNSNDGDDAAVATFRLYTSHKRGAPDAASSISTTTSTTAAATNVLLTEQRSDPGMTLDSAAIECLDLVVNSRDGTANSTVLSWLLAERPSLPVAARMLRQWLLRPSSNAVVISARQATVRLLHQPSAELMPLIRAWNALLEKKGGADAAAAAAAMPNAVADPNEDGGGGDDDENAAGGDDDDENGGAAAAGGGGAGGAGGGNKPRRSTAWALNDNVALTNVDFERLLSRISDFKSEDVRVSLTEPLVHYPKNMQNIHTVLKGFELLIAFHDDATKAVKQSLQAAANSASTDSSSAAVASSLKLLTELLESIGRVKAPMAALLAQFPRARILRDNGYLLPEPGQNEAYDRAEAEILQARKALDAKLLELRAKLKDNSLSYCDIGKDCFLVEVPTKLAAAASLEKAGIPRGELVERARTNKNVKFAVTSLQSTIAAFKRASTAHELAIVATLREVAANVCKSWPILFAAARAAGYLDCLFLLANVARQQSCQASICFPEFPAASATAAAAVNSDNHQQTSITLKGAYHPLLLLLRRKCVPNDITLGDGPAGDIGRALLLTGPNMAGKSTLMRTVAVNVILAQIGCPVCATGMTVRGAPVDRVFTRIGAKDATHRGQSTLFVELSETATIMNEATGRSLCLLDELGRGTSTHDGYAIAHACLRDLAAIDESAPRLAQAAEVSQQQQQQQQQQEQRLPLVLFATHYHALALEVSLLEGRARQRVQLGYMDFASVGARRQREAEEAAEQQQESAAALSSSSSKSDGAAQSQQQQQQQTVRSDVEFLYRLVPGICARSYGAEVALQAGLPRDFSSSRCIRPMFRQYWRILFPTSACRDRIHQAKHKNNILFRLRWLKLKQQKRPKSLTNNSLQNNRQKMFRASFTRLASSPDTASAASASASSSSSSTATAGAKPHLPHLEGYVSKRVTPVPNWLLKIIPEDVRKWIPLNKQDLTRIKVSSRLWGHFSGRVILQRVLGGVSVGTISYLFVCWLDGVAPYMAVSEDPNTAFQHPHWLKVANERTQRERELRRRIESSGSSQSMALEHATRAYSSHQSADRLG